MRIRHFVATIPDAVTIVLGERSDRDLARLTY